MPESDAELLAATANGSSDAFDTLVVRHADALHRFGWSLGMRPPDLEDALQESFIAAWRTAATFRGAGTVRSWLFGILRNRVRTLRRARRTDRVTTELGTEDEELDAIAYRAGWGRADGEAGDARELVHRALERLDNEDREVLVLRHMLEFSGEETAAALHLSLPAMKSRLHRARLRLAAQVRELDAPLPSTVEERTHAEP